MIKLTIDGKSIEASAGENLVDVALQNGIYIPTLCHMKDQPCLGTCRVCSVSVDGRISAACTVSAADGMVVDVSSPDIADMRKALVETLFSEGTHNCPSCEKSGHCDLQAVGYEVGMMVSRFDYRYTPREREYGADAILLERDRCIFCQRCVEFIRDQESGKKIFSIHGRGAHARIEIDITLANKMTHDQVAKAAEICPVGTIIQKNTAFHIPMGQRKYAIKSIRERALEDAKTTTDTASSATGENA